MKKDIIIWVVVLALIGSLYLNFQSAQKVSSDDLFQKKLKCASYRSEMEDKVLGLNFTNESMIAINQLEEIWFSPTMSSCFYSYREYSRNLEEKSNEDKYHIYDYLNSKLVFTSLGLNRIDSLDAFNKRKEELKK